MKFLISSLIAISVLLNGCAVMSTKSKLEPVKNFKKSISPGSLMYRVVYIKPMLFNETIITSDAEDDSYIGQIIKESGVFSSVASQETPLGTVTLRGDESNRGREAALKIDFPVNTDYFLDLQYTEIRPYYLGRNLYILIHAATLGLIPFATSNNIRLNVTLYDKRGNKLQQQDIIDDTVLWSWTPLYLVNGGRLYKKILDAAEPTRRNVIENMIAGLNLQ